MFSEYVCLVCVCVREREGGGEREIRASYKREKSFGVGLVLSGCFVHRQQLVKMFRLSSGTPCLVSMCVCVFCVCVCVREGERERERERERKKSFIKEREKLWCGSCAVWMFRPSSAAGQDVSSFVRHPVFSEYVCV